MTKFFLRTSQIAAVVLALTVFFVLAVFVVVLVAAVSGSQASISTAIIMEPPGELIIAWLVLIGIIVAGALGAAICDRLETTD